MHIATRRLRAGLLLIALLILFGLTLPITLRPGLQTRLTAALGERFDSQVELKALRISVLPYLRVAGEGIVLRHKGRTDVPPLILIESFSAQANLFGLIGRPLRLRQVHLTGLQINVPPGGLRVGDDDVEDERASPQAGTAKAPTTESPLIVDDLLSERAVLRILRRTAGKRPRLFEIHHLSMQGTGSNDPWTFEATLTNPKPPGRIATSGTFGPWNAAQPSATPLDAEYEFQDADLAVFDGIRGRLQSTGAFKGVLERIEVDGRARVPDFALSDVGQPVALDTRFHSIVDGTNGNTWLDVVDGTFLQTGILAKGGVVERDGEDGRTVTLDVVMGEARVEDVLRLAVRSSEPAMTGALTLTMKLVLPPGHADAIDKLRLDGSFGIATARFAKGGAQEKLNELSQKARGEGDESPDDVASDFKGRFVMGGGVIRFSNVSFTMPGARIDVGGAYTLRSEALDFKGTVRLDAKLSQLTTGAKSFLLRLAEPLFRRGNVTVVPITIGGTAAAPKVGLDLGRTLAGK
jgi:hypothetical protein